MTTHKIDLAAEGFCAGARRVRANGADDGDRIEGWRGDMMCLSSTVAVAAALVVRDDNAGTRFLKWRPFPGIGKERGHEDGKPDSI
mgnify:CR=1 FL=1